MATIFPLPDDYFASLSYTPEQLSRWKHRMRALMERTLREEQRLFASEYANVDPRLWKQIKTKDRLRVYKPRRGAASAAAVTSPCVLAVGTIEGTLEDVIYGIHNTTTRDIRVTRAFLSDTAIDAAVLHMFENGTEDDPYRSLALKWRAISTPAGRLVKNRDASVLDYMGIDRDSQTGTRYAFHISESVDHPICPPFTSLGVVRADVHVRTIYRELDATRVGVYFHGKYNMSGQIPKVLASWSASTVAISVGNSVACAEAKKLTALALANRQQGPPSPLLQTPVSSCSVCRASPSYSGLKQCRVCTKSVCAKCWSYKHLLTDAAKKVRVVCCVPCMIAARLLPVDPRRPLRLVSLAVWIAHAGDIKEADTPSHETARFFRQRRPTWPVEPAPRGGGSTDLDPPRTKKPSASTSIGSAISTPRYATDNPQFVARVAPVAALQRAQSAPPPPVELWKRMQQLRAAAEHTAQLTQHVNELMHATSVEPTHR